VVRDQTVSGFSFPVLSVVCPLISVICPAMAKFLMLFILVTLVVLMVLATFKGKGKK
jgi:hypothetical protein